MAKEGIIKKARILRKEDTTTEKILWNKLRRKNFSYKFKRQQSIGNFIADFYCPEKKLIIEIDTIIV